MESLAYSDPAGEVRGRVRQAAWACWLASALTVAGLMSVWSTALLLWGLWTTDPLKSIGMVVPAVSFVLVLRVWRSLGWETDGSWWGLALLAGTAAVVRLREESVMVLVLSPQWNLYFPPFSLVALAYGVGAVLLFGGPRLVRASVFPLALLVFVNPVPHVFNVYVDLPLQRASAHVARGFAMALGQPLSADKLRLMFTPEFGMFIAPGCNGIRGAVTMGFLALVAGYLYRFRWRAHAAVVLAAVMLGYVFNFVRLCVLVLFYLVALKFPALQDRAENADYLIGAGLFFIAVYLLSVAIQRLGGGSGVLALPRVEVERPVSRGFWLRAAAMAGLALLGSVEVVRFYREAPASAAIADDERRAGQFPATMGRYTLVRSWNETLLTGALLFHWGEYAREGGGTHVSIGIGPAMGAHDTLLCHTARGEDPLWHGQEEYGTAGQAVAFSTAFYNDGATQYLEATTLCNGTSCGEYASARTHFGLVYSRIRPQSLLMQDAGRPIPILLKVETIDTTLPVETARRQLGADLTAFLAGVPLDALTRPYRL